jgi:uncharacterized protein YqfB (UPF0267 family)
MKASKFRPELATLILAGKKTVTWRLFDDKDFQTGDDLELINSETKQPFAQAIITDIKEKELKDLNDADQEGHERFSSDEAMYRKYREYYPGREVGPDTVVKIIHFKVIRVKPNAPIDLTDEKIKNARAIIWKWEGAKRSFLITQESSGSFTIPGGAKDLEDVDLLSALQRELNEELGLLPEEYSVKDLGIQKEYENLYKNPQSVRFGKDTVIHLFAVTDLKKQPVPGNEIKDVVWLTEEEALNSFNGPHMKELFELALKAI